MPDIRFDRKAHGTLFQKGSVFFYILLGVALFGVLAFSLSRGFRSRSTDVLTGRQAVLAASDLLDYAQGLERAVNKVRRTGCSESDVSFAQSGWGHTDYDHTPAAPDTCKIFHPDGGRVLFESLNQFYARYVDGMSRVSFVARSEVTDIGTTCAAASCVDLVLVIRMFHAQTVCREINKLLKITPEIPVSTGVTLTSLFDGTFVYGSTLSTAGLAGESAGCYQDSVETYTDGTPYYDFYYVLLER